MKSFVYAHPRVIRLCTWLAASFGLAVLCHCTSKFSDDVPLQAEAPATGTVDANVQVGAGVTAGSAASANESIGSFPNMSGAQGSMTIASSTAPDLCLAVSGGNASSGVLVLRSCDASLSQRWVLVNGNLQSSGGLCLAFDSNARTEKSNVAVTTCDSASPSQLTAWKAGRFTIAAAGEEFCLQSDRAPPSSRSVIQFGPFAESNAQQLWNMGQYSHDDAQKVIQGGTHIVPLDARTTCLTVSDANVAIRPCKLDPNQAWQLTERGQWQNQGRCIEASVSPPVMAPCAPDDPNQKISLTQGMAESGGLNCLLGGGSSDGSLSLGACDSANARIWIVGL